MNAHTIYLAVTYDPATGDIRMEKIDERTVLPDYEEPLGLDGKRMKPLTAAPPCSDPTLAEFHEPCQGDER